MDELTDLDKLKKTFEDIGLDYIEENIQGECTISTESGAFFDFDSNGGLISHGVYCD